MAHCIACGSELQTYEYQSRSADEAHTRVTTCTNCPINATKLQPDLPMSAPYRGRRFNSTQKLSIAPLNSSASIGIVKHLILDVPKDHLYMSTVLLMSHVTSSQRVISSAFCGKSIREGVVTLSGPGTSMCLCAVSTEIVGMGAMITAYDKYPVVTNSDTQRNIVRGTWAQLESVESCNVYLYQHKGAKDRKILVDLGIDSARNSSNKWTYVINAMYSKGIIPSSISNYIQRDTISKLSNLSSRAWDVSSPPKSGHIFTCKPDGERMWVFLYGKIWYMVRPRFSGEVLQWTVSSKSWFEPGKITVIDVESVARHGIIVIDVLADMEGQHAPEQRDMYWVILKLSCILSAHKCLDVTVRNYYETFDEASTYSSKVPYPTDGVVAIRNGSTSASKIKDVKSMELVHSGNGVFTAADGHQICSFPDASTFKHGAIVEIRFVIDSITKSPTVLDVFERSDKQTGNSREAIYNIISSCFSTTTSSDTERRPALLWCSELRKQIQIRALKQRPNKSIVLDVGSGDGQSLDAASPSESTSYIYVEPDPEKCKLLRRRLGKCNIIEDPKDILPYIRSLKTRSVGAIIVNNKLESISSDSAVMELLCPELKCLTCTFSMHFIIDELHEFNAFNVPVYGCTYLYDTVNSAGVLLNISGVDMRLISPDTARVLWGRDTSYDEPATTKRDYAGLGKIVPGSDIIPLPDVRVNLSARTICGKVSLLLP